MTAATMDPRNARPLLRVACLAGALAGALVWAGACSQSPKAEEENNEELPISLTDAQGKAIATLEIGETMAAYAIIPGRDPDELQGLDFELQGAGCIQLEKVSLFELADFEQPSSELLHSAPYRLSAAPDCAEGDRGEVAVQVRSKDERGSDILRGSGVLKLELIAAAPKSALQLVRSYINGEAQRRAVLFGENFKIGFNLANRGKAISEDLKVSAEIRVAGKAIAKEEGFTSRRLDPGAGFAFQLKRTFRILDLKSVGKDLEAELIWTDASGNQGRILQKIPVQRGLQILDVRLASLDAESDAAGDVPAPDEPLALIFSLKNDSDLDLAPGGAVVESVEGGIVQEPFNRLKFRALPARQTTVMRSQELVILPDLLAPPPQTPTLGQTLGTAQEDEEPQQLKIQLDWQAGTHLFGTETLTFERSKEGRWIAR